MLREMDTRTVDRGTSTTVSLYLDDEGFTVKLAIPVPTSAPCSSALTTGPRSTRSCIRSRSPACRTSGPLDSSESPRARGGSVQSGTATKEDAQMTERPTGRTMKELRAILAAEDERRTKLLEAWAELLTEEQEKVIAFARSLAAKDDESA